MVVQAADARLKPIGFAVAGGRSRRMGRDKALLPWPGGDLLAHTLERLRPVSSEVRILSGITRRYEDRGVAIHVDAATDAGPIGGLLAALRAADGRPALVLGVDLPLVPVSLLSHLVSLMGGADVVVPLSPGGPEPLCAVYGPACHEPVERAVAEGRLKMTTFWSDVRVLDVGPPDIARFGDPGAIFTNVNDPTDYERARARFTVSRHG